MPSFNNTLLDWDQTLKSLLLSSFPSIMDTRLTTLLFDLTAKIPFSTIHTISIHHFQKVSKNYFNFELLRFTSQRLKISPKSLIWSFISSFFGMQHGVWKSQKKYHSTLRAKRATFTFWVDKSSLKMPKIVHFGDFLKAEVCGQTVLPDWSILSGQKLIKNTKNWSI